MFKRNLDIVNKLKENQLWTDALQIDIKEGNVFPAIRNGRMDFYHKGGKLFTFDKNGFKTHIKYASVYRIEKKDQYISEIELENARKITQFHEGYERIKENCSLYSGIEALGVSEIYSRYSYAAITSMAEVIVLDIEISLESRSEEKEQDRIDLLLFDKKAKRLIFCEAKHFSNNEIWSKDGKPKVTLQIERYERQVRECEPDIIKEYINYIKIANNLFEINLPDPISICSDVILIIFGFDSDQLKGRFKTLFKDAIEPKMNYYPIGKIAGLEMQNLIKKCKL